jgi:hypothetical protein
MSRRSYLRKCRAPPTSPSPRRSNRLRLGQS